MIFSNFASKNIPATCEPHIGKYSKYVLTVSGLNMFFSGDVWHHLRSVYFSSVLGQMHRWNKLQHGKFQAAPAQGRTAASSKLSVNSEL